MSSNSGMDKSLATAGFVAFDRRRTAIYGSGETREKAWAMVVDGDHTVKHDPSDFEILPATAALIELVASTGGDVYWREIGFGSERIVCTEQEAEAR